MTYSFRGFEMHGHRMWERRHVIEALDFIEAHGMTALVLHEGDLMHQIVFPRSWFDPYAQWKSAPARRGENALQNNRVYFASLLELACSRGIELWLEVKELAFPDEVLEAHPHLVKNGIVCPSELLWRDFIHAKTSELVADFPLLSGVILSPGSPEGRASRAQNKCRCPVCAATPLADWYDGVIRAMHEPLAAAGKRLAVRDFAYKPADHAPLIEAVGRQERDVIFCIKATPHDFYPTFPDNPAFGRLDRPQWIEYDTMGQFFGWGVVPCFMADDIRARLDHAAAAGAEGGLFRAEWERINDIWSLETFNALNTAAAARLARDPAATNEQIVAAWLVSAGRPQGAAPWLLRIMEQTWPVIRGAMYIDDFLFSDCSMFPRSIGRAWWTMEVKHSLADWAPEYRDRLDLDATRIAELLAEKQAAREQAERLLQELDGPDRAVPEELRADLRKSIRWLPLYAEGMALCAEVCLRARWHERSPDASDRALFTDAVRRLEAYGDRIRPLAQNPDLPHQLVMQLDHLRVADIVAGAEAILGAAATA